MATAVTVTAVAKITIFPVKIVLYVLKIVCCNKIHSHHTFFYNIQGHIYCSFAVPIRKSGSSILPSRQSVRLINTCDGKTTENL